MEEGRGWYSLTTINVSNEEMKVRSIHSKQSCSENYYDELMHHSVSKCQMRSWVILIYIEGEGLPD